MSTAFKTFYYEVKYSKKNVLSIFVKLKFSKKLLPMLHFCRINRTIPPSKKIDLLNTGSSETDFSRAKEIDLIIQTNQSIPNDD